jgi:arylsulfatase A-like enzyme
MWENFRRKVKFFIDLYNFKRVTKVTTREVVQEHQDLNYLLVTFDSCRYDSFLKASTSFLNKYGNTFSAWTPATYTYPAHMSFFTGILPMVHEPVPYVNRFVKQLFKMQKAGANLGGELGSKSLAIQASKKDMIHGLREQGFYTLGSAAANWFDKEALVKNFHDFKYQKAQSAEAQCNYILDKLSYKANKKRFFAFLNLYETHTPYMHYGADREEFAMNARDHVDFPPVEDTVKMQDYGRKLHQAQIKAVEHLDKVMESFLPQLPKNTLVIITADHGEAFGEDGFWGHGVYHPTVMNVPMMCFMLDGTNVFLEKSDDTITKVN